MTYEVYRYIFVIGAVLAGIMFVISVAMFFVLKIPSVIGDLTGATARKAIENIRISNENTGNKIYRTSPVNRERGKLTDKISPSGRLIKNPSTSLRGAMETEKIAPQQYYPEAAANATTLLADNLPTGSETTVLAKENETTLLTNNLPTGPETTVLAKENETTLLTNNLPTGPETTVLAKGNETTVLAYENYANETGILNVQDISNTFVVEYEITYIHSNEVIT